MRSTTKLMKNWQFTGPDGKTTAVDLPHTWNNIDGQDGGNDYWRGTCIYKTQFTAPAFDKNTQQVWLQFEGVNASAKVTLNGVEAARHDGQQRQRHRLPPEGRLHLLRRHLPRRQPAGRQPEPHRAGLPRRPGRADHAHCQRRKR